MSEQENIRNENTDKEHVDAVEERARELAQEFTQGGYMVVRKELFAHLRDPAIVIRYDSITFNTACIEGLEAVVYINIMVNEELKRIAIRASDENDKDALRWCVARPDKRKTRKIVGKPFSRMLYRMMGWNPYCRHKILGYKVNIDGEDMYIFDLTVKETIEETSPKIRAGIDKMLQQEKTDQSVTETVAADEPRPFSKDDIPSSFGLPLEESRRIQETASLDGYTAYHESENAEGAEGNNGGSGELDE